MSKRKKEPSLLRDAAEVVSMLAVAGLVLWGLFALISVVFDQTKEEDPARCVLAPDAPCEGVGRVPEAARYLGGVGAVDVPTLEIACETDAVLPEWWDPDAADIVWADHSADVGKMVAEDIFVTEKNAGRKDGGSPDWNLNSSLVGWDGRRMEVWEMDLFSRIFYLEFWQPNMTLCEAGCDAMLKLWELNGGTMFETLSHVNANGSYAFSTYPGVWEAKYDPDGLAWCRDYCEERFLQGPEWIAQYFRKGQYHDWGEWSPIPAYEIEGIYFSIGKGQ